MTIESIVTVVATILAVVSAPFIYMWSQLVARVAVLEEKQLENITKEEARQLLDDRLESMKDGIKDIQTRLDKIIDTLIKK